MNLLFELCVKSILAQYHKLQLDVNIYEYVNNKDVNKIMNKSWKDKIKTQRIYSGSATRSPSLPYSTPRVTYSRFFSLTQRAPFWRRNLTQLLLTPINDTKLNVEF